MSTTSTNTPDLIGALVDEPDDGLLMQLLAEGQYGKRMLQLLAKVRQPATELSGTAPSIQRDWFELLSTVQRTDPEVFRTIMLDPDTAALLRDPGSHPSAVGQIAAAAAILASHPAVVVIPVTNDELFLPCLGTALMVGAPCPTDAEVRITADGVTLTVGDMCAVLPADFARTTIFWRPLRWLSSGKIAKLTVRFAIDGPVSDEFTRLHPEVASLDAEDADEKAWQHVLDDSWQVFECEEPAHAKAIASGVRAIVPLPRDPHQSFTVAGVLGAIAISVPASPDFLAVTLVHEFQHTKLAAALDLVDLYDSDDAGTYYAPWRPDPRPLGGLLHGIYAFFGVSQFWNVRRKRDNAEDKLFAHLEFLRWRDCTWQACQDLVGAPALTSEGRAFIGKLLDQLELLRMEEAPKEVCRIARLITFDQRVSWRLRNLQVDHQGARRLAEAWLSGSGFEELPSGSVQRRNVSRKISDEREQFLLCSLRGIPSEKMEMTNEADRHFIQDEYEAARDAYAAMISRDPGDLESWARFAVAAGACDEAVYDTLMRRIELVTEVYQQAALMVSEPPDLRGLVGWLSA